MMLTGFVLGVFFGGAIIAMIGAASAADMRLDMEQRYARLLREQDEARRQVRP